METLFILTERAPDDKNRWGVVNQVYIGRWLAPCFVYPGEARELAKSLNMLRDVEGRRPPVFGTREISIWEACINGYAGVVAAFLKMGGGLGSNVNALWM